MMKFEDENLFLIKPRKYSLITIIFTAAMIVIHAILWGVAGFSSSSSVAPLVSYICWGIVVPVIIIILVAISRQFDEEADYISLIFGIAYIVLAAFTIYTMSLWIYANIRAIVVNIEYIGFYLGLLGCKIVMVIMQILLLIAGVRNIQFYTQQLH